MREVLAAAVYEAGTIVGRWPAPALAVARARRHGVVLDPATDLVVEGFPRSANTLAVVRIAQAQPRPIRIAHHVHAPGHVIAAVRAGVPCVVLIREPEEAVVELVLLKPFLTVRQALRGFLRFYRPLLGYRDRIVVARTPEVAGDPGAIVRRVNERFGTSLVEPRPRDAGVEEAAMAALWAEREGPGLPLVGRTDATERGRDRDRARIRAAYRADRLTRARDAADALHRAFTSDLPEAGGAPETPL